MLTLITNGHPLIEIGVKILVGYLNDNNIETCSIFLDEIKDISPTLLKQIIEIASASELIGFSLMSKDVAVLYPIIESIKALKVPIVLGGIHATALPEESLDIADYVCVGEGELPITQLYNCLLEKKSPVNIPNIGFKEKGVKRVNPSTYFVADLDQAPYPDYNFLNSYIYSHTEQQLIKIPSDSTEKHQLFKTEALLFYSQRGCPNACTYCSNSLYHDLAKKGKQKWYRYASAQRVISELRAHMKSLPFIKHIAINDDDFIARDIDGITEITNFIKRELGVSFTINGIPNQVTEEKVQIMVNNGLKKISFGVQSGSKRIISRIYHRPQTNAQVIEAANICHKFINQGLAADYGFITDNPYETNEDIRESLKLIMALPKSRGISLYSLAFFPGTKLAQKAIQDNLISNSKMDFNKLYQADFSFTYVNCLFFMVSYHMDKVPLRLINWLMSDSVITKRKYWFVRFLVITLIKRRWDKA